MAVLIGWTAWAVLTLVLFSLIVGLYRLLERR